ncbi:MAG: hypothetical protein JWQ27_1752 [Ferruginibacter sp.]|nr:hypothetical protein [Ferruginibacter sp.]
MDQQPATLLPNYLSQELNALHLRPVPDSSLGKFTEMQA